MKFVAAVDTIKAYRRSQASAEWKPRQVTFSIQGFAIIVETIQADFTGVVVYVRLKQSFKLFDAGDAILLILATVFSRNMAALKDYCCDQNLKTTRDTSLWSRHDICQWTQFCIIH